MKNPFKKAYLPSIDKAVHYHDALAEQVDLFYKIRTEDGFARHVATEVLMLERAAMLGNTFAVWELAMHYFYDDCIKNVPISLHWWKRAILAGVSDAVYVYKNSREYMIYLINNYKEGLSDYSDMELRLALLTEIYLFELGSLDWKAISNDERMDRIRALCYTAAQILDVPFHGVDAVPGLPYTFPDGHVGPADGLAHPEYKISLRLEMIEDAERLIAVIFHELGHLVCFKAMGDKPYAEKWGLTPERIATWYKDIKGYEVTTEEEDPDTLSYGVYTNWAILFAKRR